MGPVGDTENTHSIGLELKTEERKFPYCQANTLCSHGFKEWDRIPDSNLNLTFYYFMISFLEIKYSEEMGPHLVCQSFFSS